MDAQIAGLLIQFLIAVILQITDLAKSLLNTLFSGEYLSLIFKPILPLMWGPWTPWTTNVAFNIIITQLIYACIVFGAVWIATQLLILLGVTLAGAALAGFQFAVGTIVEICLNLLVTVQWWWRVRADPVAGWWQTQAHFRVQQALPPYAWVYWSEPWLFTNGPTGWEA